MHPLAKKLMMARKLDFGEDGKAELLDEPIFLMDGRFLLDIEEIVGDEDSYEVGKQIGKKLVRDIGKTGLSGTKMIEFMMDLLTMSGLGKFEMHEFNLKKNKGEVRLENSLVGREAAENDRGIGCPIISGILSGIFTQNFGENLEAEEVACISREADLCRFKVS